MVLKIIDNKAVDLTDIEWQMFQDLCASYDSPPAQRGKDLFVDLFEVDGEGNILFLKPPKRQTSFEIMFFVMSVLQAQQLRRAQARIDMLCDKVEAKLDELNKTHKSKK